MKIFQHLTTAIIAAALFILFVGGAFSDIPVRADPGLTGLSTITTMEVQGIAMTSTAVILQHGSYTLNDSPLTNGGFQGIWWAGPDAPPIIGYTVDPRAAKPGTPVPSGEVQDTAEYGEAVIAVSGHLSYQKTMGISTANKTVGEDNIAADRLLTFVGGDGGRMTTSEDILIDGTGAQTTVSANPALCPFAGATNPFLPPFCNIVASGSSADISTGSVSTSTGVRFTASSTDVPIVETYLLNVKGVTSSGGYVDASGTVSAFTKSHLQEGTETEVPRWFVWDPLGYNPVKAEDISYSETSTATGSISRFTKNMQYQSGILQV